VLPLSRCVLDYGYNDSWRVLPSWKQALDAPGAVQMRILKTAFMDRPEWWNLVPDQTIFASGGNTNGQVLSLAAQHKEGRWVMVYLADKASVSTDMTKVLGASKEKAFWIDPRTGESTAIGSFPNRGQRSFQSPASWEHALLILQSEA
jgi:hypothetical protein